MANLLKQLAVGDRVRFMALIVIMITITGAITIVTLALLYNRHVEIQREQLGTLVKSQARLIESVAAFDAQYSREDNPGGSRGATLSQVREAHELWKGFGDTGEFLMGSRDGDKINFLLDRRFGSDNVDINEARLGSPFFQPMQHALRGESGTIIGLDYRGVKVLAAYEPVSVLNVGLVAKIDMAEVRQPYIRTGIAVASIALVLIILGTILFRHITNPLIHKLELQVQEQEKLVAERTADMEKAMTALSKNEARTRQMLDDSPAAVAMVTEEGKLVYANPRVSELFAIPSEQIMSRNFSEFWAYPEDREAYIKRIKQDGYAENYEAVLKRADGHRIWCLLNARLIEIGGQWLVLGWIHDITEIKKMQEIISSEREQLQHILDISPVGVGFSVEGKFHFVNQKFLELVDAKIGASAMDIYVHPEDRDKIVEMLKKDRHVDYYEVQMYSPQREVRDIYVSYIPIKYQGRDGVLGWLLDITELKAAERELQISEQRLGLAISAGHFTPWEYNIKVNRIQTFTLYEQILGYDQGEKDDTMETWLSVVHPDDRQLITDGFNEYINSDKNEFQLSYRAYTRDRQERWIEGVGTVTDRDADGQAVKITGMQHDITEQKRSEEIIAEKISELEKFNRLAVGRELRMIELKQELNDLLSQTGENERYKIVE